jgi:hypothetical protein
MEWWSIAAGTATVGAVDVFGRAGLLPGSEFSKNGGADEKLEVRS